MGIEGLHVSFNADASPNGAAGFKAWLEGMIAFHLPNMDVVVTVVDIDTVPATGESLERAADLIWRRWRADNKKIQAIKDLRMEFITPGGGTLGLKEAKDAIDAAAQRNQRNP